MRTTFKLTDIITGKTTAYRLATVEEVADAPCGHVTFGCTNCGLAHWTSKSLSLNEEGGYNGARNIFYYGNLPECQCSSKALRMIVPETLYRVWSHDLGENVATGVPLDEATQVKTWVIKETGCDADIIEL